MAGGGTLREKLDRGATLDVRGHGKAGGGLILALQSFGRALVESGGYDVVDWPLFSAARRGATVCAYLRIGRGPVELACPVTEPDVAILMNETAAVGIDFAEGTAGGLFVINTAATPAEAAARYRLGGTVVTIDGDELGRKYLGRPLANVAVLAALVRTTALVELAAVRASLETTLRKHRLGERHVAPNLLIFDEAVDRMQVAELPDGDGAAHRRRPFEGYGPVAVGAQSALRTARANHTAGYGRTGVRIEFADPGSRCNGCSLCVVQCPEGIVDFTADPARGAVVHGARFDDYCKVCAECVAACPLDLFHEVRVAAPAGSG